jgi:MFS family permease
VIARYRSVLVVPGSLRLYVTALLARLPQGMSSLATLLLVRATTHSYAVAGLATGGEALASAAAGPLQGRLVDRFGRGRVLGPCAVAQAAMFVALVLAARTHLPGAALVTIACAIGAAQPAIAPAVRALLRIVVVDPQVRESAYALEAVIQELIWMTGPLIVGAVAAAASPSAAVLVCPVLCLAGTAMFVSAPASRGGRRRGPRAGAAVLRGIPELRAMLLPVAFMGAAIGATEVGLPSLALHTGSPASTGLLLATWSAGSMIGGLAYGSRSWSLSLSERYRRLLAAAVLCGAPLIFADSIPVGIVGALLTGLTISPVFSCQYALIGRAVPDGVETEAFTWVSSSLVAGLAGGSALGGALIGSVGVDAPFGLACLLLALAAVSSVRLRGLVPSAAG